MKKVIILFALIATVAFSACTPQRMTKEYGGTTIVKLEPDEELICATFKEDNLWLNCRNVKTGEVYMRESSSWGVLEGRINFVKSK